MRWLRLFYGWIGYKLGACPHCQSDDCHPTVNPYNCPICRDEREMTPVIWDRFKLKVAKLPSAHR